MVIANIFTMAYNAQNTIHRTIDSILNQTRGDFEYYILDNGSDDDTGKIISKYAKIDGRIKPLRINKNDPTNGSPIWATLIQATSAKYLVWCDADDEYTPDFLENMVEFAEKNQLDIAACGYEMIDGYSNEVIKNRALPEHLIVHDKLFVDEFINYRWVTAVLWGKLYSVPFLRAKKLMGTGKKQKLYIESSYVLWLFKKAARVGLYGKAMYRYYQYPNSLARTNIKNNLTGHKNLWHDTKNYLKSYGPISKLNEDFLYAIHLALVDEVVNTVFTSELATDAKLSCLIEIFEDPVWSETMARDADPQFRNLAARKEYVSNVKNRALALPGSNQEQIDSLLRLLNPFPSICQGE